MIKWRILFFTIFSGFIFANINVVSVYAITNPVSDTVTVTATVLHDNFDHENNGGGPTGVESVIFKGYALPNGKVTLIKNGEVLTTIATQIDGKFEIHLSYLNQGYYNFSLRAEDFQHLKSTLDLHTIYIANNITTIVDGIFIPPTVSTNKIEVKKGDPITIFGYSVPNAEITLSLYKDKEKDIFKKIIVSGSGNWFINFDSNELNYGEYNIIAKATTVDGLMSPYSSPLSFVVSKKNIKRSVGDYDDFTYDLNHDGHVNLPDFSILVYWYKRSGFPPKFDFNHDNKIDLIDFSMMIFHWTG